MTHTAASPSTAEPLRPGVAALLAAMESGRPMPTDGLADDAVLDATVPNWRLTARGAAGVRDQLGEFYRHPGQLEQLDRWAVPGGELVEITLAWVEDGVPHTVHQSHRLDLDDAGRIRRDTMFCGGRWSADLLAQMEATDVDG